MRMRHAAGPEARNQTWGRARASHAVRRVVTTVPVPMEEQCRRASARARKRKQSDAASEETKEKETESDRLRKKRCIQGESARARKRKQSNAASEETKEKETESDRLRKKRCIQGMHHSTHFFELFTLPLTLRHCSLTSTIKAVSHHVLAILYYYLVSCPARRPP